MFGGGKITDFAAWLLIQGNNAYYTLTESSYPGFTTHVSTLFGWPSPRVLKTVKSSGSFFLLKNLRGNFIINYQLLYNYIILL